MNIDKNRLYSANKKMHMLETGSAVLPHPNIESPQELKKRTTVKLYSYVVTIGSFLLPIGVLWDLSWHASIGRDKFLTPPHVLICLSGIFGGLVSGVQMLLNSFRSSPQTKNSLIKLWGIFYTSLGAMICIWGAIAMVTAAPFDNWWHAAYGLDATLLSPPHFLLVLGMFTLQFGACISIAKQLNLTGPADRTRPRLQFLLVIAASSWLCLMATYASAFLSPRTMRTAVFYQVATAITLLILPAFSRVLRMKWGMTAMSITYFLIAGIMNWILQLFPATPKLGPILTHITHFQPLNFPLLIMAPALLMDIVMRKSTLNHWGKAALLSVIFVSVLIIIQYPFSGFLIESPGSRNLFFGGSAWGFKSPPDAPYRYKFNPKYVQALVPFVRGVSIAVVIGILLSRFSLGMSN